VEDAALPMIRRFQDAHDPVLLMDFDGTLVDRSRYRHSPSGGSPTFREVMPNVLAMVSGAPSRGSYDAALDLAGEMTIEALCIIRQVPGANTYLVSFSASGETDPTNYQWSLGFSSFDALRAFWEHGAAGTDDAHVTSGSGRGLPQLGVPFVVAETRELVGAQLVSRFYVNAEAFGGPSAPLPAPTGGTSCTLKFNHSGGPFPEWLGLRITPGVRTETELRASRNHCLGEQFGALKLTTKSLWVGGQTTEGVTVVVALSGEADSVALIIEGPSGAVQTASMVSSGRMARFVVTGLDPDTGYSYWVTSELEPVDSLVGHFRTAPEAPASFTIAFSGDASNGSRSSVFTRIRELDPLFFVLNGDAHYSNITTNDEALFHAAFDEMLASPEQAALFSSVATVYMPDDHDAMGNDSYGGSASRDALCRAYRARVPSHALVESGPTGSLYHSFDVGNVRFVVTDLRTAASNKTATDNASKSMLGAAQRAWFDGLLGSSAGKLIVWICTRLFGGVPTVGADHWGGFSAERAAIATVIHTLCPGRVIVIAADAHALGPDDGSNHDYLSGGGEPIPTFQAAPLDRTPDSVPYGGASYSEGWFNSNGQFGTAEFVDNGATIDVTWKGYDVDGNVIVTHTFPVGV